MEQTRKLKGGQSIHKNLVQDKRDIPNQKGKDRLFNQGYKATS